jgi:hypothetical protein
MLDHSTDLDQPFERLEYTVALDMDEANPDLGLIHRALVVPLEEPDSEWEYISLSMKLDREVSKQVEAVAIHFP